MPSKYNIQKNNEIAIIYETDLVKNLKISTLNLSFKSKSKAILEILKSAKQTAVNLNSLTTYNWIIINKVMDMSARTDLVKVIFENNSKTIPATMGNMLIIIVGTIPHVNQANIDCNNNSSKLYL